MVSIISLSDLHYGFSKNSRKILKEVFVEIESKFEDTDIVIISGDIASVGEKHFKKCLKLLREVIPNKRVIVVPGNHDFWDCNNRPRRTVLSLDVEYNDYCSKLNIDYLSGDIIQINNLLIAGFGGWYNHFNAPTNDKKYLLKYGYISFKHLQEKAYQDLQNIMYRMGDFNKDLYKICVTHFAPFGRNEEDLMFSANPSYYQFIAETFDMLQVGHSHRHEQWVDKENDCLVLNPGGSYDRCGNYLKAKYIVTIIN